MAGGNIPVMEALRVAMRLAEALRVLHDGGRVHGALTPARIELTENGIRLLPADVALPPTFYKAPEIAPGHKPNTRTDIFAFGAIVLEMLAGREALAARTPSGSPAVDRLLSLCMAPNPNARESRMRKIILELKLLTIAAQRAQASRVRRGQDSRDEIREMESRLEARLTSRLRAYHSARAEFQKSVGDAVASIQQQLASVEQRLDAMEAFERTIEDFKARANQFERRMAADLSIFKHSLKEQTMAINEVRSAMSQTDEMVKRVVEALESLQTAVLDAVEPGNDKSSIAIN
jgi:serine/threonine protein kinase